MQLHLAAHNILDQLKSVVADLTDAEYLNPASSLNGSTMGQHVRHTLEFFLCLEEGLPGRVINYDNRNHDHVIESDRYVALASIGRIAEFLRANTKDLPLTLEVGYQRHSPEPLEIATNFNRELAYNIEHAVHHMAIMKIGLREVAPYINLAPEFGVAVSTLRYRESAEVGH